MKKLILATALCLASTITFASPINTAKNIDPSNTSVKTITVPNNGVIKPNAKLHISLDQIANGATYNILCHISADAANGVVQLSVNSSMGGTLGGYSVDGNGQAQGIVKPKQDNTIEATNVVSTEKGSTFDVLNLDDSVNMTVYNCTASPVVANK